MGHQPEIIEVCQPADRESALGVVLQSLAPGQRAGLVESLRGQDAESLGPFDALVTAKRGEFLAAAAWAQPQPGRTASFWPPQASGGARSVIDDPTRRGLTTAAVKAADAAGVSMTQTLLESERDPSIPALEASGFKRLATLCYLQWERNADSGTGPVAPSSRVTFEPHAGADRQRLAEVVQLTYEDTLDCPGLEGVRDVHDSLDGYRQVGQHDPSLWFFMRSAASAVDRSLDAQGRGRRDAGVLILSPHPLSSQLELVYVGVVPKARGQGLGAYAVQHAKQVLAARGMERIVLAVDAANAPALRVYNDAGFVEWARRLVYVRRREAA